MEKIDRLVWAAGRAVVAYGLRIGLRANSDAALEALTPALPPGWTSSDASIVDVLYSAIIPGPAPVANVRRYNLLYAGAGRLARTMDAPEVVEAFESSVASFVAEHARRRVFVHAGVVVWKGRAILLPGRSYAGKSTLVAELVRQGAVYYSDEYAVLDRAGRVHPFARPLGLRLDESSRTTRIAVETLGGVSGTRAVPLGWVVTTRYREGSRWRPRSASAGQGLLDLLANTVSARRNPARVLSTLRTALSGAHILRGVRGEAVAVAADLLKRAAQANSVPFSAPYGK